MNASSGTIAGLWLAAMLIAAGPAVAAQGDANPTIESITTRIESLEQDVSESGTDQAPPPALEQYRGALQDLQEARQYREQTQAYRDTLERAPMRTRQIRRALAAAGEVEAAPIPDDTPLQALEQSLDRKQADLTAQRSELQRLEETIRAQRARPEAARTELAQARDQLSAITVELGRLPRESEGPDLTEARRTALQADQTMVSGRVDLLEQELLSNTARVDLLVAQSDQLTRRIEKLERTLGALRNAVGNRREAAASEAARQARQARDEAQGEPPLVQGLAQENARLSQELTNLLGDIEALSGERLDTQRTLDQLSANYESARQQLEIAGLTQALGEVLRQQRSQLPALAGYRQTSGEWEERIANARLRAFQLDELRRELSDVDARADAIMAQYANAELTPAEHERMTQSLRALLRDRQALVDRLAADYSRYVEQLTALHRARQALAQQATQYANLLDESLIWIASAPPIGLDWFVKLGRSVVWLLSPSNWRQVASALAESGQAHPFVPPLALLVMIGLIEARSRMRRRLRTIAGRIGNVTKDRFHFTVEALAYAVLYALPWPILIATVGRMILLADDAGWFALAVGSGLLAAAFWFLVLESFRSLCAENGLIQAHFRWKEQLRGVLKRHLPWLMMVALPGAFLVAMTEAQAREPYREALGRLAFIVGSLGLSAFLWLVFQRGLGALARGERPGGWRWRLHYLVYPVAVGSPVALSLVAAVGYYYTAVQLEGRLYISGWILIGAVIVVNLVVRWLNVAERRLALARARARREQAQAQRATRDAAGATAESAPETVDVPEIDLETISEQTRQLLRVTVGLAVLVSLWLVWSDLLPALSVIGDVTLWHQTLGSGESAQAVPITLGNLGFALVLVLLTFIAARNLTGLLELTILRRLDTAPGNRYAIATISRYVIVTIGLLWALNSVGISWQQAQWLVAAVGVGLGFGLQEIFANFVSGLIILFERPIRVGDTVTVGNVTGRVSRIRMRATTITDWDRKELIVPNKSFITDQVINWTLSDPINRIIVKIRVAYGSDPTLVQRLITEVAQTSAIALDDPAPEVHLLSFGEDALNFELRVFIRDLDDLLGLTHEMHVGIAQALREHGIEIPYPQQDIYIRSAHPTAGDALAGRPARRSGRVRDGSEAEGAGDV